MDLWGLIWGHTCLHGKDKGNGQRLHVGPMEGNHGFRSPSDISCIWQRAATSGSGECFWYQLSIVWRCGACFFPLSSKSKFSGPGSRATWDPRRGEPVLTFAWFTQAIEFVGGGNVIVSISRHAEMPVMLSIVFSFWSFSRICSLLGEQTNGALGTKKGGHVPLLRGKSVYRLWSPVSLILMVPSHVQGQ